jgi:hypothetical protein
VSGDDERRNVTMLKGCRAEPPDGTVCVAGRSPRPQQVEPDYGLSSELTTIRGLYAF